MADPSASPEISEVPEEERTSGQSANILEIDELNLTLLSSAPRKTSNMQEKKRTSAESENIPDTKRLRVISRPIPPSTDDDQLGESCAQGVDQPSSILSAVILRDVALENSKTLLTEFEKCHDVADFLHADIRIPIHSTTVSDPHCLNYKFDLDGIMIQMKQMLGILANIFYINFPHSDYVHLTQQYNYLKKHVPLSKCTAKGLRALKNSVGHKLGHVEGGYILTLCAVPTSLQRPDARLEDPNLYGQLAAELLKSVTVEFQKLLNSLPLEEMCRPTIQKQGATNMGSFRVLRQDQMFILKLLDEAVERVNSCTFLKVVATLGQFGQRDGDGVDLTDVVNPDCVDSVSYHLAVKITAAEKDTHLFFSRFGLQDITGVRGSLFSTLGMHEACNFQSNLDTLSMDLSQDITNTLSPSGLITFVQLYADTPHFHYRQPFKHPVSGALVTCRLSHPNHQPAVISRATKYITHMQDLNHRLVCQVGCRIEQVVRFESGEIPVDVKAGKYFNMDALTTLLSCHALLIPFADLKDGLGLLSTVRSVVDYLIGTLRESFRCSEGVGRYDPTWRAFQAELALEELFFGHPLSALDNVWSASLGTCSLRERSNTHQRGFLGLAPHNSASLEESPPPLHHWTRDALQTKRIERIWAFCQCLDAGPPVIGAALLKVLLGDLYKRNEQLPWAALKSDQPPGRLVGALDMKTLSRELATKNSFPAPNTFKRARELVEDRGQDVANCLEQGFVAEAITYFPSFKFVDTRGTRRINWNFKDWVYVQQDGCVSQLSVVASNTLKVLTEIERRSLCFSRNLELYRAHGMPWMAKSLERLPQAMAGTSTHLNTLTFISCLAIIQNGGFVDFVNLKQLLNDMSLGGVSQKNLQDYQILGRFINPKVKNVTTWNLHPTIPYRIQQTRYPIPSLQPTAQAVEDIAQPDDDVQAVEDQDDARPVVTSPAMCLPANHKRHWTKPEDLCINTSPSKTHVQAFQLYLKTCSEKRIPSRSFEAFRRRRQRLMSS